MDREGEHMPPGVVPPITVELLEEACRSVKPASMVMMPAMGSTANGRSLVHAATWNHNGAR